MIETILLFPLRPGVTDEQIEALRAAWQGRADCEIVTVEGGEHGFVHDPERAVHRPEDAKAAWDKTLDWLAG